MLRRTVLRVQVTVQPVFRWDMRLHGGSMFWHIWVEDSANEHIYHSETWVLTAKMAREAEHRLAFTIPIFEPLPSQYYIRYSWITPFITSSQLCMLQHCEAWEPLALWNRRPQLLSMMTAMQPIAILGLHAAQSLVFESYTVLPMLSVGFLCAGLSQTLLAHRTHSANDLQVSEPAWLSQASH